MWAHSCQCWEVPRFFPLNFPDAVYCVQLIAMHDAVDKRREQLAAAHALFKTHPSFKERSMGEYLCVFIYIDR